MRRVLFALTHDGWAEKPHVDQEPTYVTKLQNQFVWPLNCQLRHNKLTLHLHVRPDHDAVAQPSRQGRLGHQS